MPLSDEQIAIEWDKFNDLQNVRGSNFPDYGLLEIYDNDELVASWNCEGDADSLVEEYKFIKFIGWLQLIENIQVKS